VPVGEGAVAGDFGCACDGEEKDETKGRDREGVQVKRMSEVPSEGGAGGAGAAAEEAGKAGEGFETARKRGE